MVSVSPSTAVERRLYSIVRWFGLIITTLALALSIIAVFIGLSKLLYHSNSTLETPSTSYEDFRRIAEARRSDTSPAATDTTLQQKQEAAAAAAAEADFEARLKPHLDAIVAHLASYAAKTDQAKPAAPAIGDYIRLNMKQFSGRDDTLAWGYVKGLENATRDLAADGDRLSKLPGDDARRVRWDAFLDWYTQQYIQQINAELQRINAETEKAISYAAEAPAFFYAGAVAFGVVIITTLFLLLLRIELNTRPLDELRPIADDLHRLEAAERGAHNLDVLVLRSWQAARRVERQSEAAMVPSHAQSGGAYGVARRKQSLPATRRDASRQISPSCRSYFSGRAEARWAISGRSRSSPSLTR